MKVAYATSFVETQVQSHIALELAEKNPVLEGNFDAAIVFAKVGMQIARGEMELPSDFVPLPGRPRAIQFAEELLRLASELPDPV